MFVAGYVGAGKDATVSYGTLDFKFKNTRKYPIMIKTSIGGGVAKVSIFGIKEDVEYEVEISANILSYTPFFFLFEDNPNLEAGQERLVQYGMNGCKSITYKIKKLNGKQVSSEVLSTDTYDTLNKIIQRGVENTPVEEQTEPVIQEEPPAQPVVNTPNEEPVSETVTETTTETVVEETNVDN